MLKTQGNESPILVMEIQISIDILPCIRNCTRIYPITYYFIHKPLQHNHQIRLLKVNFFGVKHDITLEWVFNPPFQFFL